MLYVGRTAPRLPGAHADTTPRNINHFGMFYCSQWVYNNVMLTNYISLQYVVLLAECPSIACWRSTCVRMCGRPAGRQPIASGSAYVLHYFLFPPPTQWLSKQELCWHLPSSDWRYQDTWTPLRHSAHHRSGQGLCGTYAVVRAELPLCVYWRLKTRKALICRAGRIRARLPLLLLLCTSSDLPAGICLVFTLSVVRDS